MCSSYFGAGTSACRFPGVAVHDLVQIQPLEKRNNLDGLQVGTQVPDARLRGVVREQPRKHGPVVVVDPAEALPNALVADGKVEGAVIHFIVHRIGKLEAQILLEE
jgi:hypothetical protein